MTRIRQLFRYEQASGLLMIAAIILALVAANSPFAPIYDIIFHTPVHFRLGPLIIDEPLIQWINEGLMVFFFLIVGLEIKRQFLEGHLSTIKRAVLPAFAAIGGMLVPAANRAATPSFCRTRYRATLCLFQCRNTSQRRRYCVPIYIGSVRHRCWSIPRKADRNFRGSLVGSPHRCR